MRIADDDTEKGRRKRAPGSESGFRFDAISGQKRFPIRVNETICSIASGGTESSLIRNDDTKQLSKAIYRY